MRCRSTLVPASALESPPLTTTHPKATTLPPSPGSRSRRAGGPVLELAIGTGRIALPLAATGVRVDGIELSPAMIERLRAKPGGHAMTVACGDMAVVEMPDRYRLVYVV